MSDLERSFATAALASYQSSHRLDRLARDLRVQFDWPAVTVGEKVELIVGGRRFWHVVTGQTGIIPDCPGLGWTEEAQ